MYTPDTVDSIIDAFVKFANEVTDTKAAIILSFNWADGEVSRINNKDVQTEKVTNFTYLGDPWR